MVDLVIKSIFLYYYLPRHQWAIEYLTERGIYKSYYDDYTVASNSHIRLKNTMKISINDFKGD